MGGWCKERYNKDENNKLEGLHQKPDQKEEIRWEGQNFSEVVAPQEEEEGEKEEEVVPDNGSRTRLRNLAFFMYNSENRKLTTGRVCNW